MCSAAKYLLASVNKLLCKQQSYYLRGTWKERGNSKNDECTTGNEASNIGTLGLDASQFSRGREDAFGDYEISY